MQAPAHPARLAARTTTDAQRVGRSSLTHWQFLASSPFLCQVASSAQAGGEGTDGAGSDGDGSAGPEAGGGVCARIATSIRAALSIVRRDIPTHVGH